MGISAGLGPSALLPGLVLVKSQTVGSAVSSVSLTDAFNSTFDSYKIVISNVTMSSTAASTAVWLKMHDGSNPASTNYNYGLTKIDIATGSVTANYGALITNGVVIGFGTGDKFGTAFEIVNPFFATHTIFPNISGVNVSTGYFYSGSGMHQTSTAYPGFHVYPGTGTMTGGTIRVYGYRN